MKFPFITIDYVIADVRAELKRLNQSGEINDLDCINYAVECIREIGGANYVEKPVVVRIENHIGYLPKGLYLIQDLWLCGSKQDASVSKIGGIWFSEEGFSYCGQELLFPGDSFTGSKYCSNYHQYPKVGLSQKTYIVRHPNQIRCSVPNCIIGINGLFLPCEGTEYLMQDEIYSIKAVKAFIKTKVLEEKWIMGEIPNYVYDTIKQDYTSNLDQAQAMMKFPDPADDKARGHQQDHRYDNFKLK